jgi:aspartyl-tRNA(Asn)/glutamyl-tRNA(Gln) amidotransferase subunit A
MTKDLTAARDAIQQGRLRAADALTDSLARADSPINAHTFIRRFDAQANASAAAVDSTFATGAPLPRLAGLAISVKDLFNLHGQPTTAASRVLAASPPAEADCPAVARLRAAGAALTGHTNMTEFAFSGVGINPHHGTPANAGTLALDPQPRIPGGSTSGGAVSVASGAAWAALGSDTGGSIRIPAALQGLVGFKNTARLTPTEGAIPLSTTLDTACAITRSVRDAVLLHEVLAERRVSLPRRPIATLRLGLPTRLLDGMDATVASAFERALSTLRHTGARIDAVAAPEIDELAAINATGGFSAAESWAWHRPLITQRQTEYDPRVAARIRRGETMSAADYINLLQARASWISRMTARLQHFDALLSPTVPIVAPTIASLANDAAFFATNALLLRNPSIINMLDGCALSLPCHSPDQLPVGLMVWSHALQDDTVLDISLTIEHALAKGGH